MANTLDLPSAEQSVRHLDRSWDTYWSLNFSHSIWLKFNLHLGFVGRLLHRKKSAKLDKPMSHVFSSSVPRIVPLTVPTICLTICKPSCIFSLPQIWNTDTGSAVASCNSVQSLHADPSLRGQVRVQNEHGSEAADGTGSGLFNTLLSNCPSADGPDLLVQEHQHYLGDFQNCGNIWGSPGSITASH